MPYKFDTDRIKLPRDKDRRVKLTDLERVEITRLFAVEHLPIREIARRWPQISRRTIQFVIFPERYEHQKRLAQEWRRINGNTLQRYGKKAWAKTQREHRHYKQKVIPN